MPFPQLDRAHLRLLPLRERPNRMAAARDLVRLGGRPPALDAATQAIVTESAARVRAARAAGAPVLLATGAHAIKNGLGPVLIRLLETGWLTHLATNGAGIIHDWELAFQGETSEDVRANVAAGQFGLWQETGFHLNLALALGAFDGLGYGEAVGRLIATERHDVPPREELLAAVRHAGESPAASERAAAAADLLALADRHGLAPGRRAVPHPHRAISVQAAAYRLGVPCTGHPMFGHDIIYTHPLNCGAALGRCAERDFLAYAHQVARLEGGVYFSVGSAVMSPMIFEKSLAMAQNLARQAGRQITRHFIVVVDLARPQWDWRQGEPPPDHPDYYLRFCKSFSRMGGEMRYAGADNRDFLLGLAAALGVTDGGTT